MTVKTLIAQGQAAEDRGEYEAAVAAFERALAAANSRPTAPALMVTTLVALGNGQRTLARFDAAERHLCEALTLADASFAPTDPQLAGPLNALAVLFKYSGRFDEAEPLLTRALAILAGQDHPDAATILHNLGGLHHARRDFAAAEPFARRAVEWRIRTRGEADLMVAADRAALAPIADALGQHAEAEALLLDALTVFERELGPDHYEVAVTLNNLAAIAQRGDDLGCAEARYRRALTIKEQLFGAEHPDVAVTLNNLATVCQAQHRAAEAQALYGRALATFERVLEPGHPTLTICRENLAACQG
jgi:tetratricopeptide (TPR) repeat protein